MPQVNQIFSNGILGDEDPESQLILNRGHLNNILSDYLNNTTDKQRVMVLPQDMTSHVSTAPVYMMVIPNEISRTVSFGKNSEKIITNNSSPSNY
jgi:hypothetical protein